jgi:hypothetical protein
MMVLNNKCMECNKICNCIYFQYKFIDWTSGNNDIDKFIQDTQLLAHKDVSKVLEWIPYNRFYDIKYTAKGGFGKVYSANWINGKIICWDTKNQNWKREECNMFVNLKSLDALNNFTLEFVNKV